MSDVYDPDWDKQLVEDARFVDGLVLRLTSVDTGAFLNSKTKTCRRGLALSGASDDGDVVTVLYTLDHDAVMTLVARLLMTFGDEISYEELLKRRRPR